jgi:macrodomain Ter protein organizer (MatP/YcbG family)
MDTTLKISVEARDRLRVLANRHGRTLGEEVAALVEAEEQRQMWASYPAMVASLSPETRASMAAHAELALREATERQFLAGSW